MISEKLKKELEELKFVIKGVDEDLLRYEKIFTLEEIDEEIYFRIKLNQRKYQERVRSKNNLHQKQRFCIDSLYWGGNLKDKKTPEEKLGDISYERQN